MTNETMKLRNYRALDIYRAGASIFLDPSVPPRIPSSQNLRREWRNSNLPYGLWVCADGREVLFNRHYQPIYERHGHGNPAFRANLYEWVPFVRQSYFYNDGHTVAQAIRIGMKVLQEWGITYP